MVFLKWKLCINNSTMVVDNFILFVCPLVDSFFNINICFVLRRKFEKLVLPYISTPKNAAFLNIWKNNLKNFLEKKFYY